MPCPDPRNESWITFASPASALCATFPVQPSKSALPFRPASLGDQRENGSFPLRSRSCFRRPLRFAWCLATPLRCIQVGIQIRDPSRKNLSVIDFSGGKPLNEFVDFLWITGNSFGDRLGCELEKKNRFWRGVLAAFRCDFWGRCGDGRRIDGNHNAPSRVLERILGERSRGICQRPVRGGG